MKALAAAVASLFAGAAGAQVLPTGYSNTAGNTTMTTSGAAMSVNQTTQRAIIDWTTFNIGNGASVTFTQPGATSVAVNRVSANGGSSEIAGALNANGHVMLLNPNGIAFTSTATVNVGGLIASTGKVDATNFDPNSTGPIAITGATAGTISNQGTITVTGAGLAAFVAPSVSNSGTITAAGGRIVLASAQTSTISLNGGLYEIAVNRAASNGSAVNSGTLSAAGSGGTITLSAGDAANLISGVINLEGFQQANAIVVNGNTVELSSVLQAPSVSGNSHVVNVHAGARIQDGVNITGSGGTVNVDAGTYTQPTTLNVNKSLTLNGAGETQTIIDARSVSGYGMLVNADNVSLSNFTLYGPTANAASSYGIKVQPVNTSAPSPLKNFSIANVTSRGAFKAELDLNSVVGATIDHVTANGAPVGNDAGSTAGAGIQLTNSANVTISNSTTLNNQWGGVALYEAPSSFTSFDQQMNNITVQGNNSFTESVPLYLQDQSATKDFGALNLLGFNYAVRNSGSADDSQYTWLQYTLPNAFNLAVNVTTPASSVVQDWSGTATTQNFEVGIGNVLGGGTRAMSIATAIASADSGASIHVGAGTYAEQLSITKSLTLAGAGAGQSIIAPTSLAPVTYTSLDGPLAMKNILTIGGGDTTNVDVSGFTIKGPVLGITSGIFVRDGAHAHIHDNSVIDIRDSAVLSGVQSGIGIFVGRAYINTFGAAVIENNVITGYQKGGIVVDGPGTQATVTGNTVRGEGPTGVTAQNGIQISRGASATVTGNTVSGNSYTGPHPTTDDEAVGILVFTPGANLGQGSITIGPNTVSNNEIGIWTNDPRTLTTISLTGDSGNTRNAEASFTGGYASDGILLAYPAWSASNAALVNAAAFSGTQSGDILDVGGALRVSGWSGFTAIQPAVNSVAAGGTVDVAAGTYAENVTVNGLRNLSFNGSTIHSLTLNSGAGGSGIGGSVTADGAAGFMFNAPIVLLSNTMLSTNGGNIALNGDVQNAGASRNSLSLIAGSGTALGDANMVTGGTQGNPLGELDVTSNNFTLLSTLWVTGYKIAAASNVALSNHTLRAVDAGASNTINAGGNVTGTTISNGNSQVTGGGDVSANITAQGDAVVSGNNVSGNITGDNIVLAAQNNVNASVNATSTVVVTASGTANLSGSSPSLSVDAPSGNVSGGFSQVNNVGGGVITVNGAAQAPDTLAASTNASQLLPSASSIVENTAAGAETADALGGSFANSPSASSTGEDSGGQGNGASQRTVRDAPARAGELILQGRSVEIDLSPANDREKNR
jgi:filamentous hemagglutinin family protein